MRMLRAGLIAGLALVVCFGGSAVAEEWIILGPRALGMGGAGVAAVDDVTASYWNPAALSRTRLLGVQLDFGVSIGAEGGILQEIDELYDTIDNPGPNGNTLEDWDTGCTTEAEVIAKLKEIFKFELPKEVKI